MTISNNFFFGRIIQPSRLASVLILAGCALWLGLRVPVNYARTVTPANPLPDLREQKAIEHLKQEGLYDTLAVTTNPLFAQETKLTASNGAASHRFGGSVAISGDTAVVGAPDASGPNGDQGAAYVFVRSGTAWTQQQKLTASDGVSDFYPADFGSSVAISWNTVVVGMPGATIDYYPVGAAFVFVRGGTAWTQQQKLTVLGDATVVYYGWKVAISGNTVSVLTSCYDWSEGGSVCPESVYVYVRSGTTWTLQQKLTTADNLGTVAVSGDTLAIGAPYAYTGGAGPDPHTGAVYVYVRNGTAWTLQQRITASDVWSANTFGGSVAISGNTLAVGAPYETTEGLLQYQGAAYVFARSGTTWTQQQKLMASDRAPGDQLGSSVAVSGGTVVAGAPFDDIGANQNQGSAYVFVP